MELGTDEKQAKCANTPDYTDLNVIGIQCNSFFPKAGYSLPAT